MFFFLVDIKLVGGREEERGREGFRVGSKVGRSYFCIAVFGRGVLLEYIVRIV